jgi:hypothetical protein
VVRCTGRPGNRGHHVVSPGDVRNHARGIMANLWSNMIRFIWPKLSAIGKRLLLGHGVSEETPASSFRLHGLAVALLDPRAP